MRRRRKEQCFEKVMNRSWKKVCTAVVGGDRGEEGLHKQQAGGKEDTSRNNGWGPLEVSVRKRLHKNLSGCHRKTWCKKEKPGGTDESRGNEGPTSEGENFN